MTKNVDKFGMIFIIFIIILGGLFLRAWNLGDQSLWIDEGYTINASQAIIDNGYPVLKSGENYNGWFLTNYITAGSMALFSFDPFNPWSARLPSVLFGIAVIVAVYLLTQSLFKNRAITLTATFLTTFAQWEIAWSTQARGYTAVTFFILLTLLFFWKFIESQYANKKFLYLSIVFFICALLTTQISLLIIPALGFWWLIDIIIKKQFFQRISGRSFIFFIAITFLVCLVFFKLTSIFFQSNNDASSPTYFKFLFGEFLILSLGTLISAILSIFDKKRLYPVMFIFVSLTLSVLLVVGYYPITQLRYIFPFFPLMLILFSYTIYRLTEIILSTNLRRFNLPFLTNIEIKNTPEIIGTVSFILATILLFSLLSFSTKDSHTLKFSSPQPDFETAFSIIKKEQKEDDLIISPYTALHQIYLGKKGLWLIMSLSGKISEIDKVIINDEYEYYVGAPIIRTLNDFADILDKKHGFIVIDDMARVRLQPILAVLQNNPKVKVIFESKKDNLGSIWLYNF